MASPLVALFVALATPLPVIVRSAAPETISSLPPIQVANWPIPDAVAWWTLYVAAAAALLALATLFAVGRQIKLAREALDLARDELDATNKTLELAKQELDLTNTSLTVTRESNRLVQESLNYAREQSEYLSRKADLRLYSDVLLASPPEMGRDQTIRLRFFIANNGTKSARGAAIQILLQPGIHFFHDGVFDSVPGWNALQDWNDGEILWSHFQCDLTDTFFPATVQLAANLRLLRPAVVNRPILWRLLFDDGMTPQSGSFNPLTTMETLNRQGLLAAVPPPVE